MNAKDRQCAIKRTQEALEVTLTAFEAIKDTPPDEQHHYQQGGQALLLAKQLLHDQHEAIARKLA